MARPNLNLVTEVGTAAPNYDLTTEDIVAQLQAWDDTYGIAIDDVEDDAVTVIFQTLPADPTALAAEIYQFCPDIIDQHFGCFDDLLGTTDASKLPTEIQALIADVDFDHPDFGLRLLEKSLTLTRTVPLWWD